MAWTVQMGGVNREQLVVPEDLINGTTRNVHRDSKVKTILDKYTKYTTLLG
jgi:hypothetical protein